jgi:hypothetical protein
MPIAVAGVAAVRAALPVAGAAHRVGIGRHQRFREGLDHLPEQVRAGPGQLLGHPARQVDTRCCGHRVLLVEDLWKDFKQDHAVAVSRHDATHINAELADHVGGRNSGT